MSKKRTMEWKMDNWNDRWEKVIKNIEFDKREPMWEQAIEHLISEGVMGPTMAMELSQGAIQEIILDRIAAYSIYEAFVDIGIWVKSCKKPLEYCSDGSKLWLAYLMATQYAMEWDGDNRYFFIAFAASMLYAIKVSALIFVGGAALVVIVFVGLCYFWKGFAPNVTGSIAAVKRAIRQRGGE